METTDNPYCKSLDKDTCTYLYECFLYLLQMNMTKFKLDLLDQQDDVEDYGNKW